MVQMFVRCKCFHLGWFMWDYFCNTTTYASKFVSQHISIWEIILQHLLYSTTIRTPTPQHWKHWKRPQRQTTLMPQVTIRRQAGWSMIHGFIHKICLLITVMSQLCHGISDNQLHCLFKSLFCSIYQPRKHQISAIQTLWEVNITMTS